MAEFSPPSAALPASRVKPKKKRTDVEPLATSSARASPAPPPEAVGAQHLSYFQGASSSSSLTLPGLAPPPQPIRSISDPNTTGRGEEGAPYLTHVVHHHGKLTLVAPDNLGVRRQPTAAEQTEVQVPKKKDKVKKKRKPRVVGPDPDILRAVAEAGRTPPLQGTAYSPGLVPPTASAAMQRLGSGGAGRSARMARQGSAESGASANSARPRDRPSQERQPPQEPAAYPFPARPESSIADDAHLALLSHLDAASPPPPAYLSSTGSSRPNHQSPPPLALDHPSLTSPPGPAQDEGSQSDAGSQTPLVLPPEDNFVYSDEDPFVVAWEQDRAAGIPLDERIARDLARRQAAEPPAEEEPEEEEEEEEPPAGPWVHKNLAVDVASQAGSTSPSQGGSHYTDAEEGDESDEPPAPIGAFERREIAEAEAQQDGPRVARALSIYANRRFAEAAERRLRRNTIRRNSTLRSESMSTAAASDAGSSQGEASPIVGLGAPMVLSPAHEVDEPTLAESPDFVASQAEEAHQEEEKEEEEEEEEDEDEDAPARTAADAGRLRAEAAERRIAAERARAVEASLRPIEAPTHNEPTASDQAQLEATAATEPPPTSTFAQLFPPRPFGRPKPPPAGPGPTALAPPPIATRADSPVVPAHPLVNAATADSAQAPSAMASDRPSSLARRPTVSTGPPPPPPRHARQPSAPNSDTAPPLAPRPGSLVRRSALNRHSVQASPPAANTPSMLSYMPREDREAMGDPLEPDPAPITPPRRAIPPAQSRSPSLRERMEEFENGGGSSPWFANKQERPRRAAPLPPSTRPQRPPPPLAAPLSPPPMSPVGVAQREAVVVGASPPRRGAYGRPLPVPPGGGGERIDALTVLRAREGALASLTRRSSSLEDAATVMSPPQPPIAEASSLQLEVPSAQTAEGSPNSRAASIMSSSSNEDGPAATDPALVEGTSSAGATTPGLSAYSELDVLLARLEYPPESAPPGGDYDDLLLVSELLGDARSPGCTPEELEQLAVGKVELERRRVNKNGKTKSKMSIVGVRCVDCGICLARFKPGEPALVLPKCLHPFHERCVVRWLRERRNCPTCREEVFERREEPLVAV